LRRFSQKATAHPRARSPWSRPQARNISNAVSFRAAKYVLLCSSLLKKNGEKYLNVKNELL
jgi:hypothetical protein